MSIEALRSAFEQSLPPSEKLVLLVLANCHNNRTKRCNPGMETIAATAGITRRGAIKIIQRLEQRGIIQVTHSRGGNKQTHNYLLTVNHVHSNTVNDVHGSNSITVNESAKNSERGSKNSERGSQEPVLTSNEPKKIGAPSDANGGKPPTCPHEEIISLYHATLPMCPEVRSWTPTRE